MQVTTGLDRFDDVRVRRKDVLRLFPVPRGRPGGSSPDPEHDMELVQEMHKLIETGEATSPHAAAVIVGPKARGGGGVESKVKRLERAFTPARRN